MRVFYKDFAIYLVDDQLSQFRGILDVFKQLLLTKTIPENIDDNLEIYLNNAKDFRVRVFLLLFCFYSL